MAFTGQTFAQFPAPENAYLETNITIEFRLPFFSVAYFFTPLGAEILVLRQDKACSDVPLGKNITSGITVCIFELKIQKFVDSAIQYRNPEGR